MRSGPFSLLCLICFLLLLGLRFSLPGLATQVQATESRPAEAMAVPPKPLGVQAVPESDPGGTGEARLTEAVCEKLATDVQDVCWQALARQVAERDAGEALGLCPRIHEEALQLECRSDVAEVISPRDRGAAEKICDGIDSIKWRGQCHFGIGLALAETDPDYAMGQCAHAEIFKLFCRHDVIGEVSLVNVEAAVATCAKEEGTDLARKTCWHGIGKYLARRDLTEAAAACQQATLSWRGNCFHGLGWGAAERDPDAALAGCDTLQPYNENCRQGVAHELKRSAPERAVELCNSIQDSAISTRCLEFVRR